MTNAGGSYNFHVKILSVNSATDDDPTNDSMTSGFIAAPNWPSQFIVAMHTNSDHAPGSLSIASTKWIMYDVNGNIVKQRVNNSLNTTYNDTLNLPAGIYKLVVSDTNGYGLHWWADPSLGSGSIRVKKAVSPYTNINLNGDVESGTYADDFGLGFTQYFTTDGVTAVANVTAPVVDLDAYPSPAQSNLNVNISGLQTVNGTLKLIDEVGRTVLTQPCTSAHQTIDVSRYAAGIYILQYFDNKDANTGTQKRIVIAK